MSRASRALLSIGTALLLLATGSQLHAEEEQAQVVAEGSRVSIEYTLSLADGSVADTNVGGQPLIYQQGASQILPALETQLSGLAVGDSKQVSLTASEGYGEVDPNLFQDVPAAEIPEEARVVGITLVAQAPNGQQRPVRVHEVKEEQIVLDLNHPLAGQALSFDVKILAIE